MTDVLLTTEEALEVVNALNFTAESTAYTDTPEGPMLAALAISIETRIFGDVT